MKRLKVSRLISFVRFLQCFYCCHLWCHCQAIAVVDIVSSCKQLTSLFFGKQDEQTYLT